MKKKKKAMRPLCIVCTGEGRLGVCQSNKEDLTREKGAAKVGEGVLLNEFSLKKNILVDCRVVMISVTVLVCPKVSFIC